MGMNTLLVCALILGIFAQVSIQADVPIPPEVIAYSASRMERSHHSFFHNSRMGFLAVGPKQQEALRKLGWEPPRLAKAFRLDGSEVVLNGDAGEDFLFMHRRMIHAVNNIAKEAGSAWRVKGWTNIPAPGDKKYPVPAAYDAGNQGLNDVIASTKTVDFYWDNIVPAEEFLNDADNLRSMTLGELGVKLEFEIHTWLHLRFSGANSVGYRTQTINLCGASDPKWDAPAYDWLADFYSAHVNPTFWKIHGWIESKIEAWRIANGLERIEWNGTWEGGPMTEDLLDDLDVASHADDPVAPTPAPVDESSDSSSDAEIDQETLAAVVKLLLAAAKKN